MNRRQLLKRTSWLLGGMLTASMVRGVTAGEESLRKAAVAFFSGPQRHRVSVLAELIIPPTDTPGAIGAGVPDFIEMMVAQWYTETERLLFMQGLQDIDDWCLDTHGADLLGSSEAQQIAALEAMEQAAAGYKSNALDVEAEMADKIDENTPFFTKLKELTVIGYYTSEVGATQELAYNSMPMRFEGDIPLAQIGRQWAQE